VGLDLSMVQETYALAGTFKFELNATEAKLDNIFEEMVAGKARVSPLRSTPGS